MPIKTLPCTEHVMPPAKVVGHARRIGLFGNIDVAGRQMQDRGTGRHEFSYIESDVATRSKKLGGTRDPCHGS